MKRLNQNEVNENYDKFSKFYDYIEVFSNLIIGRYRKRMLSQVYGKVLEVGIGTGTNFKYYPKGSKIYGIDTSKGMLSKAKEKAKRFGIKVKLNLCDVCNIKYKSRSFDYVVDSLGMCSYPNPVKALNEMKRVCRKGGKIILLEHGISNNSFFRFIQNFREEKHYSKIGCSLIKNYQYILNEAGIKKYEIERKLFGIIWMIKIDL